MSTRTIWFITGVSSGFGFELALYALRAGHMVYGTVRSREKASDTVSKIEAAGGECVVLDVTNLESIPAIVQGVLEKEGRIDVLVNNAGWAAMGVLEDMTMEDAKRQMETNFFGPLKLIQTVIPSMRNRRSGSIVNITSISGIYAFAGGAVYSASKFALEGLSDALYSELSPFNISVLSVEPSSFKTRILGSANMVPVSEVYKGTPAAHTMNIMERYRVEGSQRGDPAKAAKIIFESVAGEPASRLVGQVMHLPLGSNASKAFEWRIKSLKADYAKTKKLAKAADRDDLRRLSCIVPSFTRSRL